MPRSHPPTLLRLVERTLIEECRLDRGDGLLLAVSGGSDSTALLDVLGRLRPRLGLVVMAHGVDHGLRSEASAELDQAERLALERAIPFSRSALRVGRGPNLQARAREARYASLREHAARLGLPLIATAHHADDRAETVLIRLLRGTVDGLAVLPPRSEDLIRPMIRARKSDVLAHLTRHRLAFSHDPSNTDPHYLRTAVRERVLPLLTELSPRIVEHLCDLADHTSAAPTLGADQALRRLSSAQRRSVERALTLCQWGFELPVSGGGLLRLVKNRPES